MRSTGIVRPVDQAGRLVLPKELRRVFGLLEETAAVEIFVDGETIVLRKYNPACVFCGSFDEVIEHKGRKVCRGCINELFIKGE